MDDLDAAERAALLRVRVLRRDSYRCQHKASERGRLCGSPAAFIGGRPADEEIVALCLKHHLE